MLIQYLVQVRVHLHFTQGEEPVACQVDTDVSTGQRSPALQRTGDQIGEVRSRDTHRVGLVAITVALETVECFKENSRISLYTLSLSMCQCVCIPVLGLCLCLSSVSVFVSMSVSVSICIL